MKKIRLSLKHDGTHWVATDGNHSFAGKSLDELDKEIEKFLRNSERLQEGERVKVYMYYDNRSIPQWIRQYSQHYFDRIVEITL
jgi:FKBP-type peptidyl-prolyl cis-trans isomerase 2